MSLNTRLNNIDKLLSKQIDLERLYYPIYPENKGVCANKDGLPPCIYGGRSTTEIVSTQENFLSK